MLPFKSYICFFLKSNICTQYVPNENNSATAILMYHHLCSLLIWHSTFALYQQGKGQNS